MNFFEKICFEKREKINVFWKGNKTKDSNKDALYSGKDTAKNYITILVFPLIPILFSVIKGLFKSM